MASRFPDGRSPSVPIEVRITTNPAAAAHRFRNRYRRPTSTRNKPNAYWIDSVRFHRYAPSVLLAPSKHSKSVQFNYGTVPKCVIQKLRRISNSSVLANPNITPYSTSRPTSVSRTRPLIRRVQEMINSGQSFRT